MTSELKGKAGRKDFHTATRIDEDTMKYIDRLRKMRTPVAPRGFKKLTITARAIVLGLPLVEAEIKAQK